MNGIRLLFFLALAAAVCQVTRADDDSSTAAIAPLTTLEQVRALEPYQADQYLPVEVTGTVLFAEPSWNSLAIHDGNVGVMVFDPEAHDVKAGQKVALTGHTSHQTFTTKLVVKTLKVIGQDDSVPEPQKLSGALHFLPAVHGQWVEFEGLIVRSDKDDLHHYLRLAGREFPVFVVAPLTIGSPPRSSIEGCRIKVRGVCVLKEDEGNTPEIQIWAPDSGVIAVGPGPSGKESPPRIRLKDLQWSDVTARDTAAVQTRVTVSHVHGKRLFVTDGTEHTIVESTRAVNVSPGDLVRVKGIATWNDQKPHITQGEVVQLGRYLPPESLTVDVANAAIHLGKLISVEGTVADRKELPSGDIELLMHDDTLAFLAIVKAGNVNAAPAVPGTRLKLTGGCWHSPNGDYPFALAVDSINPVSGLAAVAGPPAWPIRVLAGSTVLLAVTALLIWLHRRQLREQRQFYSRVHEQLDSVAHVSRVNTLAEMVGALSHELSQPLASMSNFASAAESLSDGVENGPPQLTPIIGRIRDEAHRANELIRRLRQLTRRQTQGRELADIDEVVLQAVEIFRLQDPKQSLVTSLELHGDLPNVNVDTIQLEQVLLNLLNNARDATLDIAERRPAVTIQTRIRHNSVEVLVDDNGQGMSEAECRRSFEPYVTTKSDGTGLGLAISRTIVESHGGQIVAEPQEPHGTRLRLTLPVADAGTGPRLAAG